MCVAYRCVFVLHVFPFLAVFPSTAADVSAWADIEKARICAVFGVDACFFFRGEDGIRTHVPRRTNGFQDRLVMTTPTPLQVY